MRKSLFCVLFVVLLVAAPAAFAQSLTGAVRVVDGDTLVMKGERIRIHGINAPEAKQQCDNGRWSCGQAATQAMERLVAGRPVSCSGRDRDHYGRLVAVCVNHQGVDVGRELVRQGLATAYRRYSSDYVGEENAARAAGVGVWAGEFTDPESYRHGTHSGSARGELGGLSRHVGALAGRAGSAPVQSLGAWVGRVLGSSASAGTSPKGNFAPGRGYSDFNDYNNDGVIDGGPHSRRNNPLTPPSQGMAPPGAQGAGGLSADQVCALAVMLDRPCR